MSRPPPRPPAPTARSPPSSASATGCPTRSCCSSACSCIVGVLSTVLQLVGTSVTIPGADEETAVRGLFTGEGLAWLTVNLGANFIGFPPLVTVVTILLAVTVAERTGLLAAAIRASLGSAPRWLLPYAVGLRRRERLGHGRRRLHRRATAGRDGLQGRRAAPDRRSRGRVRRRRRGLLHLDARHQPRRPLRRHHQRRHRRACPTPAPPVTPVSNLWFNIAVRRSSWPSSPAS